MIKHERLSVHNFTTVGLWCAKVYQHPNYGGWEHSLYETDHGSLSGTNFDNKVSSVKMREGCILKGYDDNDLNDLIFTYNVDKTSTINSDKVNVNDKLTSYACQCGKLKR